MYVRRVELIPKTCRSFPNPGALFKKETSFFRGILTPPLVRFQAKSGWGEEPQLLLLFSTSKMQLSVACELARGREKETHTRQSNFMPLITTRFPYIMPFFEFLCMSFLKKEKPFLSIFLLRFWDVPAFCFGKISCFVLIIRAPPFQTRRGGNLADSEYTQAESGIKPGLPHVCFLFTLTEHMFIKAQFCFPEATYLN